MKLEFKSVRLATIAFASGFCVCWMFFGSMARREFPQTANTNLKLLTWNIPSEATRITLRPENNRLEVRSFSERNPFLEKSSVDLIDARPQPMIELD